MTATSLRLRVVSIDDSASDIRTIILESADVTPLPGYVAGSHLMLVAGERSNAYSLTGDGVRPRQYAVSVLRVADGAGGSAWLHDKLAIGDEVAAQPPRSAFAPAARATRHLLLAGGIGITPIVGHLRAAARWGREVQVVYAFREGRGALVDDVLALDPEAELTTAAPEQLMVRLVEVLADQPIGTHLYICGPNAMIDAVLDAARELGWPESRLHLERFGTGTLEPGDPFTVRVSSSDTALAVPSGTSLLEALEAAGHEVPFLCRQGVCGECRLTVTAGIPQHRDVFLTDDEKAEGRAVMACVSRADGPHLEVAL